MEKPTEAKVREALEEFYKERKEAETQEYTENVARAAKALGVDPGVLGATLEEHDISGPPLGTPVFEDQVKYLRQALAEIVATSMCQMEHREAPEVDASVDLARHEEPAPLEAVKYVARKLLNVNIVSTEVESFANDGDVVHEWKVTAKGWVDPVRGAELQRVYRLKRTRETIASLEESLLDKKKRLLELGGKICTCIDDALAKSALPSATAPDATAADATAKPSD